MKQKLSNIKHLALDLDGTLYLGGTLFDFTKPFLSRIRDLGIGRTFFTNNSSRSTQQYVEKLTKLGIDATENDIYSSTHCTLDYLKERYPQARTAFVLGTPPLREEFQQHGYAESKDPDLVIVGFDMTLAYDRVCEAAWWISKGKPYIQVHPDRTCPTDEPTVLVDCGAICAMLTSATGREPDAVMGKPNPLMLRGMLKRHNIHPSELAVVGDRIYTDLAMARAAGAVGVLVLTGESTREHAIAADPPPDLVVHNVAELADLLERERGSARC